MEAVITPPGHAPITVQLTSTPTYTITEQGGFSDCSLTVLVPDVAASDLRHGTLVLSGPGGARWLGHVRSAE